MINRQAVALSFQSVGQLHTTQEISRDIDIPGVVTVDPIQIGQPYFGQVRIDPVTIRRVAVGIVILGVVGDAALTLEFFMVTPIGTEIMLYESSALSDVGPFNILFDPDDQAPPPVLSEWDEIEKIPLTFEKIRIKGNMTGTNDAAMLYVAWVSAS